MASKLTTEKRRQRSIAEGKKAGGRPVILDDDLTARISRNMLLGLPLGDAAVLCDISRKAAEEWWSRGKLDIEHGAQTIFAKFVAEIEKAKSSVTQGDLATIHRFARGTDTQSAQWQAAAWRLERRNPQQWGQQVKVAIGVELSRAIERLKAEFAYEPEICERALAAIAGDIGEERARRLAEE